MENNVANENVVENVVEEIVETTKPNKGVVSLIIGGVCAAAAAVAGVIWYNKSKKSKEEKSEEAKNEDWDEKLEAIAKEEPIDDLAE